MSYSIKSILILMTISLGLTIGLIAIAQEGAPVTNGGTVEEAIELDEEVIPEDLEIKDPKLLPDSPFYFLKNWSRGIRSFFTFNKIKKAELKARFANEKLMEIKKMINEKKNTQDIKKGLENYQNEVEKVNTAVDQITERAAENEEINKFLDKFTKQQLLHQKLLQKLEAQVPPEVFEKIKEARERHLEMFGEVMTKLEDRPEKIRETLEENMEEIKGSKYKNFKNLETLLELGEKIPEQSKEAIQKAQENAFKRLRDDLEKMSPEDQEKFKYYIEGISGNKAKQLEILENLRFEIKNRTQLREKINEIKEGVIEEIQERNQERVRTCSKIDKPVSGFCSGGRIVIKVDEKGCVIDFKCVIPAEVEIYPKPDEARAEACIVIWDPVCGIDNKTYSNSCYAKLAGVNVSYNGECREKQCEIDADCPQLKCGPTGTISAKCIGVKFKCVEGKCQIIEAVKE